VYAGTSQPPLTQLLGHVEHGVVPPVPVEGEREHRKLTAVGDQSERADLGDRVGGVARHVARRLLHAAVAVEAEAQEVVVLGRDLVAGPREVQRERRQVTPEVVDPEHQVVGEGVGVAPDDPHPTPG
jgi:hypothetical protein